MKFQILLIKENPGISHLRCCGNRKILILQLSVLKHYTVYKRIVRSLRSAIGAGPGY